MTALLSLAWEPELRGILTVIIGVVVLCGSVYLLLGTNLGFRLGFLVAFAGLFGWMASMGAIWWAYGIGLQGRLPTWEPAQPFTIVREAGRLDEAGALDSPLGLDPDQTPTEVAAAAQEALLNQGWVKLPEDDQGRGQAIASADEIIQIEAELYAAGEYVPVAVYDRGGERFPKISESLDFLAFFHRPHYALVEIVPVVPQREEPGRAPARPVVDNTQPHQYVMMIRDLGTKRQPAAFITIGSTLIFALCCWLLHRRDQVVQAHLQDAKLPAKA